MSDLIWVICTLVGLTLTLVGSIAAAMGGMLTKREIEERVDSQGRWWGEAPEWVRNDYERSSKALRRGLWFIAAGTILQIVGGVGSVAA